MLSVAHTPSVNSPCELPFADNGSLDGPELKAPGGRRYTAGDHIVTLAAGQKIQFFEGV